ncbi:MAG: lysophospholipid acyltransferase family protein [Chloroflexota bacterium]
MDDKKRPSNYLSEARGLADSAWWREFIATANRLQISYWVVRFCQFLARTLPVRVSYAITVFLAYVTYFAWPAMRQTVTDNMHRVLGESADGQRLRRMVRSAYRNYFKYMAEFLRFPSLSSEDLEKLIDGQGWENLDRALEAGKGVVFVCFHFGNWDLAGAMVAIRGYPMNVVAESFEPKNLNDLIQGYRTKRGIKIIPLESAAKRVLQALRRNEILALLVDRPSFDSGVPVRLFGGTCYLPGGAATLAIRTGAKVLPGYLVRKPDNTFVGRIDPALEFEPTGDFEHDVQRYTQMMVDRLAEYVCRHPDQWFLFRRLWLPEERPQVAWAT